MPRCSGLLTAGENIGPNPMTNPQLCPIRYNEADILLSFQNGWMTRDEAVGWLMDLGEDWFDAHAMIDEAEREKDND